MVTAGLGIGILPESALTERVPDGPRAVAIHSPVLRRELVILWHRARSVSPAAEALVEAALATVAPAGHRRSRRRADDRPTPIRNVAL
jgi:DNA-binding transcriptional LysR family regulator